MLLTVQEARARWCPFVRHSSGEADDPASASTWGEHRNPPPCRCIATECMAWRAALAASRESGKPTGYCGLAGRPETLAGQAWQ